VNTRQRCRGNDERAAHVHAGSPAGKLPITTGHESHPALGMKVYGVGI